MKLYNQSIPNSNCFNPFNLFKHYALWVFPIFRWDFRTNCTGSVLLYFPPPYFLRPLHVACKFENSHTAFFHVRAGHLLGKLSRIFECSLNFINLTPEQCHDVSVQQRIKQTTKHQRRPQADLDERWEFTCKDCWYHNDKIFSLTLQRIHGPDKPEEQHT